MDLHQLLDKIEELDEKSMPMLGFSPDEIF